MRQKQSAVLAWILCAYCAISASIQTVILLSQETVPQTLYDWVDYLGWILVVPIVFSIVAALIIARRPGNRVGWLLMLPALTIAWPGGAIINSWPVPPASLTAGMWLLLWLLRFRAGRR